MGVLAVVVFVGTTACSLLSAIVEKRLGCHDASVWEFQTRPGGSSTVVLLTILLLAILVTPQLSKVCIMMLSDSFGILPVIVVGLFQTSTALVRGAPGTVVVGLLLFLHAIVCLNLLPLPGCPSTTAGIVVTVVVGCVSLLILSPASFVLLVLLPLSVVFLVALFVSFLSRRSTHRVEVPCPAFGDNNRQIFAGVTHGDVQASWYSFCCGSTRRSSASPVVKETKKIVLAPVTDKDDDDEEWPCVSVIVFAVVAAGCLPLLIASPSFFVVLLLLLGSFGVFAFVGFGFLLSRRAPGSPSPALSATTNFQPFLLPSLCADTQVNDTSCAPVLGDIIMPVGGTKSRRIFVGPNHGAAFWYSFYGSMFTQDIAGCVIGGVEKKRPASDFVETRFVVLDPVMEGNDEEEQVNEDVIQFDDDGDVVMTDSWEEENVVADGNDIACLHQDDHCDPDAPSLVDEEVPFVMVAGAPLMPTVVSCSTPIAPPPTAFHLLPIPVVVVPIFTLVPDYALSVAPAPPAPVARDDDSDIVMTDAWEDENVVDRNTMLACICEEDEAPAPDSVLAYVVPSGTILACPAVPTVAAPHPGPPTAVTAQVSVTSVVEVALAYVVPDSALSTATAARVSVIPSLTTLASPAPPAAILSTPVVPPPTELNLLLAAAPSPVITSPTNVAVGAALAAAGVISPVRTAPQTAVTVNSRLSDTVELAPRSMHKSAANISPPPATAVLRRSARLAAKHACQSCLGTTFINGRRCSARLAFQTS